MSSHYKIYGLFLFVATVLKISTNAQEVSIDWENNYGGWEYEEAHSLLITPDSNLLFAGSGFPIEGDFSTCGEYGGFIVVKTDTLGSMLWSKCYGGSNGAVVKSMINTSDGGIILVGGTYSNDGDVTGAHGNNDCWVVKLDVNGDLEWEQAYGGSDFDSGEDILELSTGGYIIVARSGSTDGDVFGHHGLDYNHDAWVFNISSTGGLIWSKCYGGDNEDRAYGIVQDNEGNLVISGNTASTDGDVEEVNGANDFWIFKITIEGNLIWSNTFGGSDSDSGNTIATLNNAYYVIGETYSDDLDVSGFHGGVRDSWLIKLDFDGNLLMQKCFGGSMADELMKVNVYGENELMFAGMSGSSDGDLTHHHGGGGYADYWVVSTDTLGNIIWQKSMGGSIRDDAMDIVRLSSSSYVTTGLSGSSDFDVSENAGSMDIWTVKLSVCITQYYIDMDGDGFGNSEIDSFACLPPLGYVNDNTDCNDFNDLVYPGAPEILNGQDDDCDGVIDEGLMITELTNIAINMYPLPATDFLIVDLLHSGSVQLQITNTTGSIVYNNTQWNNEPILVNYLPSGLYIVRVFVDDSVLQGSFVKQ